MSHDNPFDSHDWLDDVEPPRTGARGGDDPPPFVPVPTAKVPGPILDLLADLRLLKGVPFHYLVPHADLLPVESIRVFRVDPNWTTHLMHGALMAGAGGLVGEAVAQIYGDAVLAALDDHITAQRTVGPFGLLIRSRVVREYPRLRILAWADKQRNSPLTAVRLERLGPGILLAMWETMPEVVAIEQSQESMRFGVRGAIAPFHVDDRKLDANDVATEQGELDVWLRDDGQPSGARVLDIDRIGTTATDRSRCAFALNFQLIPYRHIIEQKDDGNG